MVTTEIEQDNGCGIIETILSNQALYAEQLFETFDQNQELIINFCKELIWFIAENKDKSINKCIFDAIFTRSYEFQNKYPLIWSWFMTE